MCVCTLVHECICLKSDVGEGAVEGTLHVRVERKKKNLHEWEEGAIVVT